MILSDIEDRTTIFIDANIFVYYFSENSRFNPSCTEFIERIEKGELQGISSASVVQETTHRIMMEEASLALPDVKGKDIIKYLKSHSETVEKLEINREVPDRIDLLKIKIVPIDMGIIKRSQQLKARYGLLSNDALMLQVMKDSNISRLASNDSDFERVDFITIYKPFPS